MGVAHASTDLRTPSASSCTRSRSSSIWSAVSVKSLPTRKIICPSAVASGNPQPSHAAAVGGQPHDVVFSICVIAHDKLSETDIIAELEEQSRGQDDLPTDSPQLLHASALACAQNHSRVFPLGLQQIGAISLMGEAGENWIYPVFMSLPEGTIHPTRPTSLRNPMLYRKYSP